MAEAGLECPWESIHGFVSPSEYKRFLTWVAGQISSGTARFCSRPSNEVFVAGEGSRYVEHVETHSVWRIDEPDGPFNGSFCPVVSGEAAPFQTM
jgi:hypothetical protein